MDDNSFVSHCFEPVFDARSRVLVLGTMPSPKSRENGFYYSHPKNRFWPVIAEVFGEITPRSACEKREFLLRNRVALWDVLKSCSIVGASDSSIRDPVPNDIAALLRAAPISAVFTTGAKAASLYKRLIAPSTGVKAIPLPSTSPANARMGTQALLNAYMLIRKAASQDE